MESAVIRRMTAADLNAADELRRLAGWNQTLADWQRILSLEPEGCFVAAKSDCVVGTVTTTTYGEAFAWIGMMLVHPGHQRHGIGTRLMQQVLDYLRGRAVRCVKLDATPAGQILYEKLGFVPEYTLTRYASERQVSARRWSDTRELSGSDWPAIDDLDANAFGTSRARLLRELVLSSQSARIWPAEGRVRGWGILRPGAKAAYLGPLVCADPKGALLLANALLSHAADQPVFWDIPDRNAAAAARFGFVPVRALTRMGLGPTVHDKPEHLFGIADPALG